MSLRQRDKHNFRYICTGPLTTAVNVSINGPRCWFSGQNVRLLSTNPSSNPAEVYSFSVECCSKITKKRPGLVHNLQNCFN